jgi:Transposase DDE domain
VAIGAGRRHRQARFGQLCGSCPLRAACTKARRGRVISIHAHEAALQHAKARQRDPAWQQDYRAHRPVVERKISHLTRRPWAALKPAAGRPRILTDILARASAINLARLATLGLHHGAGAGPSPDPGTNHPSRGQFSDAVRGQNSDAVDTNPPRGITSAAS